MAYPTSPVVAPGCAAAMPTASASSVTMSSSFNAGEIFPTGTVTAASVNTPSCCRPKSIATMSPSCRTRSGRGMPCTTSSLMDAQIVAGNFVFAPSGRYPLNAGMSPPARTHSSAARSSSPVVIPGRTIAASLRRISPWRFPASRIAVISWSVLMIITGMIIPDKPKKSRFPLIFSYDKTSLICPHTPSTDSSPLISEQ